MFEFATYPIIFGGIIGAAYAAKRFLPRLNLRPNLGCVLEQLASLPVGPQCSVSVIRAGDEKLVIGITPHSITLLSKSGFPPTAEEDKKTETLG